jgi:membrane-associated protease RseP (regulator of RpoE activity)
VTMINLLPIGQLDGGHIATAYFGNRYNAIAFRLHRLLPFGGAVVFAWVFHSVRVEAGNNWNQTMGLYVALMAAFPWLVWHLMISVVRRISGGVNHPPVDETPLPRSRKLLFWLMVLVFVAVFMPVPLRATLVGAPPATAAPPTATTASLVP